MEITLFFISFLIVIGAQALVSRTYSKYRAIKNKKGLTGFDVARKILDENNLKAIDIVETKGTMTDHYDPRRRVIRLSSAVYHDSSIASIAIAAHEAGHALQYKGNYPLIKIRGILVPVVNFASQIGYVVLVIGFIFSILNLVFAGIIMLALTLTFQLVTLPVEFNASKRAKSVLKKEKMIDDSESKKVKTMLNAAAMTYVASLLANLLEILRLILMFNRRND